MMIIIITKTVSIRTIVEPRTMNEKTVDTLAGEKWSVEAETLWTRLGEDDDDDDVSDGDDDNNGNDNDDGDDDDQTWRGWCRWWIYLIETKCETRTTLPSGFFNSDLWSPDFGEGKNKRPENIMKWISRNGW